MPDDFNDEATQAWRNVAEILCCSDGGLGDIVSVRQWLSNAGNVPAHVAVAAVRPPAPV